MNRGVCEICDLTYIGKGYRGSCCSRQCVEIKKNKAANERWLKRNSKPVDPGLNLRLEKKRVYNNDYLFKKFNACRG